MRSLARLAAALAAAALLGAPAPATAQEPRPTVLLFHGGGFVFGSPAAEAENARYYRRHGYRPVLVRYPLGDLAGAHAAAAAAARRYRQPKRPLFAAGTSAGGGLAAYLAATGKVDAAVGVCALTDYVTWSTPRWRATVRATSRSTRARWSTRYSRTPMRSPLMLFSSPQDTVVPFSTAAALDRRRGVTLRRLAGDHCLDVSWRRSAVRFLDRRR